MYISSMPGGQLVRIAPQSGASTVRKKLRRVERSISRLKNEAEIKEWSIFPHTTWTNLTKNGQAILLNEVGQGDDFNQRTGRQIMPTSLTLNILMRSASVQRTIDALASSVPVPYRILVVQDMGYSGVAPTIGQLLEAFSFTQYDMTNYIAGYNDDYVRIGKTTKDNPLKILADRRGYLVPRTTNAGEMEGRKITIRCSGLSKCQYSGALGSTAKQGSLYLLMFTGSADAASENNQLILRSTLRYKDD